MQRPCRSFVVGCLHQDGSLTCSSNTLGGQSSGTSEDSCSFLGLVSRGWQFFSPKSRQRNGAKNSKNETVPAFRMLTGQKSI
jgi:hypothetical protein